MNSNIAPTARKENGRNLQRANALVYICQQICKFGRNLSTMDLRKIFSDNIPLEFAADLLRLR
jgi:hypothetical protein